MKGNFHVRFLEGGGLATARLHSVKLDSRHENATINAQHEHIVIKPCVSPQVFYGSRRGSGSDLGSEASRTTEPIRQSHAGRR
jgi:hypothetical protein